MVEGVGLLGLDGEAGDLGRAGVGGRVGQGREIATVALFLATSDSSFVDGQLLRVDGGVDC